MAFSGGAVNSGGFLATGRFVSHVTGFATLIGVHVGKQEWDAALGIITVPLFFLLGSFLAGWFIDREIRRGRLPHFDYVMGGSALCLFIAAMGGANHIAEFGKDFHLHVVYILLALLCLSSGLQNAALTSSSGSSVRTTHVTGLTTDLGLGLARALSAPLQSDDMRLENRTNWIRMGTIFSFISGAVVGGSIFVRFGYAGFLLPCSISIYAAVHGRRAKSALRQMRPIIP